MAGLPTGSPSPSSRTLDRPTTLQKRRRADPPALHNQNGVGPSTLLSPPALGIDATGPSTLQPLGTVDASTSHSSITEEEVNQYLRNNIPKEGKLLSEIPSYLLPEIEPYLATDYRCRIWFTCLECDAAFQTSKEWLSHNFSAQYALFTWF